MPPHEQPKRAHNRQAQPGGSGHSLPFIHDEEDSGTSTCCDGDCSGLTRVQSCHLWW